MKYHLKSTAVATGLAMFSMFFGAGNIIFPLQLGLQAGDQNFLAMLGMFISAIIVPFTGLTAMILFDGDYHQFFTRLGKLVGFILMALIMVLIGPFGGIPRCITLTYSTLDYSGLDCIPMWLFILLSCGAIYACAYTKSRIVNLLGYFLTPLLLLSLFIVIVAGLFNAPALQPAAMGSWEIFYFGLVEGYNTLDLLAAFFFSTIVLASIHRSHPPIIKQHYRSLTVKTLKATFIGASLLTLIYVGMSYVTAHHKTSLSGVDADQLLAATAFHLLGVHAGVITGIITALATFTTAITLAAIFADFLMKEIFKHKINYHTSLGITLAIAYAMSFLRFIGIVKLIAPIIIICYPAFITLSVFNIAHKLFGWRIVKTPVAAVLALSTIAYFM